MSLQPSNASQVLLPFNFYRNNKYKLVIANESYRFDPKTPDIFTVVSIKGGLVRLSESAFTWSMMVNTSSRVEKCTRKAFLRP